MSAARAASVPACWGSAQRGAGLAAGSIKVPPAGAPSCNQAAGQAEATLSSTILSFRSPYTGAGKTAAPEAAQPTCNAGPSAASVPCAPLEPLLGCVPPPLPPPLPAVAVPAGLAVPLRCTATEAGWQPPTSAPSTSACARWRCEGGCMLGSGLLQALAAGRRRPANRLFSNSACAALQRAAAPRVVGSRHSTCR